MKGLIVLVLEHLSPDAQRAWQILASENGLALRNLQADQISEVSPRDIVVIACGLAPGQRQLPAQISHYLQGDITHPPAIIVHSNEDLVDPIVSLDEGRMIMCSPTVGEHDLRSILLHLLRLHPLAFRVIDSDAGEIQVDHSSSEWWISCRREANSDGQWPWARPDSRMNICCGLTADPTSPIEHLQDIQGSSQKLLATLIQFEPLKKSISIGPLQENQYCWILNQHRWPACHQITNASADTVEFNCISGDTIILSDRKELSHLKSNNSDPRQALRAIRSAANERVGASVLLEIR